MANSIMRPSFLFFGFIYSSLFFVLLFLEDRVSLFGVSLSNVWKSGLVLLLSFLVALKFHSKIPLVIALPVVYSLLYPFGTTTGLTMHGLEACIVLMMLPLSYYAMLVLFKNRPGQLQGVVVGLCAFILVSAIPFIMGWISPAQHLIEEGVEFAAAYGSDRSMLVAFYKHASYSSKTFAIATAIILFAWFADGRKSFHREIVYIGLVGLGLWCLYLTFVRTGWVIFAFIIAYGVLRTRAIFSPRVLVLLTVVVVGVAYLLYSEPWFLNRLMGRRLESADQALLVQISSGRVLIYHQIWTHFSAQGAMGWLVGLGDKGLYTAMSGVAPHNFLLQSLAVSGLPGLAILLAFFGYWRKNIISNVPNRELMVFNLALFYAMLFSSLVSHGLGLYGNFLLGAYLAHCRLQSTGQHHGDLRPDATGLQPAGR